MDDIVVSVVMPAYNCEKYIAKAIRSVLIQKVPLELIIVEDQSKDKTKDEIASFLQDERVHYILNESNLGVAKSRNRAIELARGKYIAFLDADDMWTENKLEAQLALMEQKQAVLSSTARELMDEDGKSVGKIIPIQNEITYKSLLKSNTINTSGTMIRADIAKKFLMTQDHLHEDYILWLRVLKEYKIAYGINEPMLKYRVMKGTKSGNKFKSAKMTWGVYRYMGLNIIQAGYYFIHYAISGIIKYY